MFDEEHEPAKAPIKIYPFAGQAAEKPPSPQSEYFYPLGAEQKLDEQEGEYVLPSPIVAIDPSATGFQETFFAEQPEMSDPCEAEDAELDDVAEQEREVPSSGLESENVLHSDDQPRLKKETSLEDDDDRDRRPLPLPKGNQVTATRPLICWLLRAYANSTGSRAEVETVWNQVRKLWNTNDPNDQAAVERVLQRCLRNCDRYGPPL
jgi:hypothetical protein